MTGRGARTIGGRQSATVAAFGRAIIGVAPRPAVRALTLMLASSLTEGIGLLLLVPLLGLLGLDVGTGAVGRIADFVATLFNHTALRPTTATVLAVYVAIVGARSLLQRWESAATSDLDNDFVVGLRRRLYAGITHARWSFVATQRASDFTQGLSVELERVSSAVSQLTRVVAQSLVATVYVLLAIRVSPTMTAVASMCGAVLLLLLREWNARARRAGERATNAWSDLLAAAHEHIGGLKTVKSFGAEERNVELFASVSGQVADAYRISARDHAAFTFWFSLGSAAVLGVLTFVSREILALPAATILLLLYLFGRLVPRFSDAQRSYHYFLNALPAFETVTRLIHECEANAESSTRSAARLSLRDRLGLVAVRFRYATAGDVATIDDVTLEIPAHRTTAVVGPSGAGKSTVADLVLGLIIPDAGVVSIDGTPLTPDRVHAWRHSVGYVAQDTFLLHDTVRANLLWAHPTATDADVREALRLAAADEFVARLPNGMDTVVGDRGVLLSGGERQRLALARALLRRPALLVLDEATSALDSENERRIQAAIEELHGRMTILVITHRLSTVRRADLIHVLDRGRLVESGTWDELIGRRDGRFRALCAAQGIVDTADAPATPALA